MYVCITTCLSIDSVDPREPYIEVLNANISLLNHPYELQCSVITTNLTGGTVDIIWSTGSAQVKKTNNVKANQTGTIIVYSDSLTIPFLKISDVANGYLCTIEINSTTSVKAEKNIIIPIPSKKCGSYVQYV